MVDNNQRVRTFDILYIDPPWKFNSNSKWKMGRNVMKEYDTESIEWVKNLPIGSFTNKNSMLLIWITDPNTHRLKEVLDSWGFKYKGKFHTWIKLNKHFQKAFKKIMIDLFKSQDLYEQLQNTTPHKFYQILGKNMPNNETIIQILTSMTTMGMGFFTRKNSESLYYATTGKGVGIPRNIKRNIRELIFSVRPNDEHSAKPHDVYDRVELMYPNESKIEFFARNERKGWERAICKKVEPTIEIDL